MKAILFAAAAASALAFVAPRFRHVAKGYDDQQQRQADANPRDYDG